MADLGELMARIGLDTSELKRGVVESEGLLSGKLAGAAAIAAAAIAAIGVAAIGFGIASAHKFEDVGREVLGLQKIAGGTVEDMSRLRFAAIECGISSDQLGGSLRILSGHLATNDQAAKDMGVAYRDANGNLLPTNDILLNLADKFKSMPNGIEKTRLATELFGRTGVNMIPILNRGRDGLMELEAAASKFGLVLSTENIDAIRANVAAHREWHAAWEGLQVQIGIVVLPLLTSLATFMTDVLVPAIGTAATFAREVLAPAFQFLFDLISTLVGAAKTAWDLFIRGFTDPTAADNLSGAGNLFFEFGQRVRLGLEALKHAWDLLVEGFKSPDATSTLSGWDGAFFTLGQNVKHALDAIALAWQSTVAGFTSTDATKPVDGLNTAFFNLGKVIRDVFDWVSSHLAPIISNASDQLANHFTGAVAGGTLAIAGFAIKAGALDGVLGTITASFEALGAIVGLLTAPVALVVAAIAALGVAAFVAYQKVKPFHDAMDSLGNFLKSTFLAALDATRKALDDFILGFAGINLTGAESKFAAFGANVRRIFETVGPAVTTALRGIVSFITDTLIPGIQTAVRGIQGPLGDFVRYIRDIAPQVQEAVKHIVEVIRRELELVIGIFAAIFVTLSAAWRQWGDDVMRIVRIVFDTVKAYIQTAVRVVRDIINGVLALINGDWGKAWAAFSDIPRAAFDLIKTLVGNAMKIIGNLFATGWDAISQAVPAAFGVMLDYFKSLPGRIVGAMGNLVSALAGAGQDLMTGFFNGIKNAWSTVAGWVAGVAPTFVSWFSGAVSWLARAGQDIITGLWNGLKAAWNTVSGWGSGIVGAIGGWFGNAVSWLLNAGQDVMTGLWNGLKAAWNTVSGWGSGIFGAIGGWFAGAATWLFNAGIDLMKGLLNGMISALDALPSIVQKFLGLDAVIRGLRNAVDLLDGAKIDITANADTAAAQQALDDLAATIGGLVDYSHPPPPGAPAFATGGLTHGPSLAGERGQELVLPMNDLVRSRQLLAAHGAAITGASGGSAGTMGQSSVTNYNLYGPIQAADPAELERQLEARARVASMAGR